MILTGDFNMNFVDFGKKKIETLSKSNNFPL